MEKEQNNSLFSLFSRTHVITAAVFTIIFTALTFCTGFLVPKPSGAVNARLKAYEKRDDAYIVAYEEYNAVQAEIDNLNTQINTNQNELDDFNKSRDSLDKITEKNTQLQEQKEQLQNEINSKNAVLSSLSGKTEKNSGSTITLSSGNYTVGENIAGGNYTVMGSGSIVISNSGKARVNKQIKSDGERFTLNVGDIVKIDGNAKFVRED